MTENMIVFTKQYEINTLNINAKKQLSLLGLLGIIQDISAEHAYHLGFGYEEMKRQDFFWVLIRQKLKMESWPAWHQTITVKTWTQPIKSFYAIREFELFVEDQKIGACSTTWMILDSVKRTPKEMNNLEGSFANTRTDYHLGFKAGKVVMPEQSMMSQQEISVKISDLDMNNHVNNIKYSQWALDTVPFEKHEEYVVSEHEINFMSEAFLGDKIALHSNLPSVEGADDEVFFSGKNQDNGKTVFVIRLKVCKG
jgi:acyl-ACP thioesterase